MMKRYIWILLVFYFLFGGLYLGNEKIHNFDSLFLDTSLDTISFGQVVKCFKHIDPLLDSCDLFEGEVNHILIHDVQLLDSSLKSIVLFMPIRRLHVQYFILLVALKFINQLHKCSLYLK